MNGVFEGLKRDTVLPMIENIDKIPIASVDGKLKDKILSYLRYLIQHIMMRCLEKHPCCYQVDSRLEMTL